VIKIELQINDDEFKFHYSIGEETQTNTSKVCSDTYFLVADLIRHCSRVVSGKRKKWEHDVMFEAAKRELENDKKRP
jgi:hypothetical protein